MEMMRYFKSSMPKGQYEVKKDGKIMAFFSATETLSEDVLDEFKDLLDDTYPSSKDSASLEYWASNFGIDKTKSKEEQFQELKQIFSGSGTSSSMQYLLNFFASFGIDASKITISKGTPFTVFSSAGESLFGEVNAFSNLDIVLNATLNDETKNRIKEKIKNLSYRYYFTIKDKNGVIVGISPLDYARVETDIAFVTVDSYGNAFYMDKQWYQNHGVWGSTVYSQLIDKEAVDSNQTFCTGETGSQFLLLPNIRLAGLDDYVDFFKEDARTFWSICPTDVDGNRIRNPSEDILKSAKKLERNNVP